MNFAQIGYRLIKIYLVFFTIQIFCAALRYVQSVKVDFSNKDV